MEKYWRKPIQKQIQNQTGHTTTQDSFPSYLGDPTRRGRALPFTREPPISDTITYKTRTYTRNHTYDKGQTQVR